MNQKVQIGLKLWSTNLFYIKPALSLFKQSKFHYIELFVVPDSLGSIDLWKDLEIPYILHAPHSLSGFNPSIASCEIRNFELIEQIDEYRKALNPEFIIFHPGIDGKFKETIRQFCEIRKKFLDLHKCMLVENKPLVGLNGERCLGATPGEICEISKKTEIGFCLDFGHAIAASNSLKISWKEHVSNFMKLKPAMFHLSDGDIHSEKDGHLNLGKGNLPINELLKLFPGNAVVTLETEKVARDNLNDFEEDLLYILNNLD